MLEFALIGTTASGKSDLALELAKALDGVILSLDSLCIYKEINIASAKPNLSELAHITHFGVNLKSVSEDFCVGDFIKEYEKAREFAQKTNRTLIITGGSGFYLKSMLSGLTPKIPALENYPSKSEIWHIANQTDFEFTSKFSANDEFRLKKWLEIYEFTHEIPSKWLKQNTKEPIIKNIEIFDLIREKDELRSRIRARTKKMFKSGLLDEANELLREFGAEKKPLKSIGLKECIAYLRGEFGSHFGVCELEDLICIHTNQLAKRQRTFNKSQFANKIAIKPYGAKEAILSRLKG